MLPKTTLQIHLQKSNFTEQHDHDGHLWEPRQAPVSSNWRWWFVSGDPCGSGECECSSSMLRHFSCVDLSSLPSLRSQLTVSARSELVQSEQGVPSGAVEKDIFSSSKRALCGWDNSLLSCLSPERIYPEDKIEPRTWRIKQSQGSEPSRIIGSHCARNLPTSGIFLNCWSQVALDSFLAEMFFKNHPGYLLQRPVRIWTQSLGAQSMVPGVSWLVTVWMVPMYPEFALKESWAVQRSQRLEKVVHLLCWEFVGKAPKRRQGCSAFIGSRVSARQLPCWAVPGKGWEETCWASFIVLNLVSERYRV